MTDLTTEVADADVNAAERTPPEIPPLQLASWIPLDNRLGLNPTLPPLLGIMRNVALSSLLLSTSSSANGDAIVVVLCDGYFWHMEAAVLLLPRVINIKAVYNRGMMGIGDDDNVNATMTERTAGMSPPSPSFPTRRCAGVRPDTPSMLG